MDYSRKYVFSPLELQKYAKIGVFKFKLTRNTRTRKRVRAVRVYAAVRRAVLLLTNMASGGLYDEKPLILSFEFLVKRDITASYSR